MAKRFSTIETMSSMYAESASTVATSKSSTSMGTANYKRSAATSFHIFTLTDIINFKNVTGAELQMTAIKKLYVTHSLRFMQWRSNGSTSFL
jgi:hypothetical protein